MHIYIKNLRTAGHFLLHTLLRQLEEQFKSYPKAKNSISQKYENRTLHFSN